MIPYERTRQQTIPTSAVKIIGVGGAGANMLDRIALDGMEGAELLACNTDVRTLTSTVAPEKIQIGRNLTKGLGSGGDPDMGRQAATEAELELRDALRDRRIVFICAGLGGGTGSGAAPLVARLAREEGAFVVVFATTPFHFEGLRRMEQAEESLKELSVLANALITFDNTRMGELVLAKQGVHEAFSAADRMVSESIRAVTRVVMRPGLVNIGLDDLMAALSTPRSRCLFGSGLAKGENRAQQALKNALGSPLLDRGSLLRDTATILVHVCGGEDMTLYELELLMRGLSKHVPDTAQILFGTSVDPAMANTLSVTLVSSLPEDRLNASSGSQERAEEVAPRKPASAPAPVAEVPVPVGPGAMDEGFLAPPAVEQPPAEMEMAPLPEAPATPLADLGTPMQPMAAPELASVAAAPLVESAPELTESEPAIAEEPSPLSDPFFSEPPLEAPAAEPVAELPVEAPSRIPAAPPPPERVTVVDPFLKREQERMEAEPAMVNPPESILSPEVPPSQEGELAQEQVPELEAAPDDERKERKKKRRGQARVKVRMAKSGENEAPPLEEPVKLPAEEGETVPRVTARVKLPSRRIDRSAVDDVFESAKGTDLDEEFNSLNQAPAEQAAPMPVEPIARGMGEMDGVIPSEEDASVASFEAVEPSEGPNMDFESLEEIQASARASRPQGELALDGGPKGKFEGEDPNLLAGEDLDIPPFLRNK